MGGIIKKIISWGIGIPAFIIFVSEAGADYFWLQILSAMVLVGIFMWNTWGFRLEDKW